MEENNFKKHFRIYFKNGHPAYIVDEDGNKYVFHRMTHSKTSGHRNNIKIDNPLEKGGNRATYVVKREEYFSYRYSRFKEKKEIIKDDLVYMN